MTNEKTVREPLLHITKRNDISKKKALLIRAIAVVAGLLLSAIVCGIIAGRNPLLFFGYLVNGAFGSSRKIWVLLRDMCLLLGVAMALLPAFKMKFWNLGGNGQIMMGALAAMICLFYLGGKLADGVVILLMIVTSILAGAVWAVIPAIFKAFFKTNESLFTLMMNYIAVGFVNYFITRHSTGSNTIPPIEYANFPEIGNPYLLTIIVVALISALMFFYFKFSKHGYEVSVVGESENTARYVGINVKKVIIRTMVLSGAICGVIGLLLVGAINHTITPNLANNMGFTAIMAAWLGKLDPLAIILTSFFIMFIDKGMGAVRTEFDLTNTAASNIVLGIIYFAVIACEFFITYKVHFRTRQKADKKEGGKN